MTRSNNGWYTVYPKFTGITNLTEAKQIQNTENLRYPYGRFDITWEYVNIDPSEIMEVRLYRAIGDFGRYTNPRSEATQLRYKLIATWNDADTTTYSDDLKDLTLNGLIESQYLEYVTDILNVRRPLYYKIECVAKSASNGMCPMIFICDGDHVVALSTKAQVICDRFYGEGEEVWSVQLRDGLSGECFVRIAVDLSERRPENKNRRVWSTTNKGRVVCFDYWTGEVLVDYFDSTEKPIYAMALNPLDGTLLYHGGSRNLISVSYDETSQSFSRVSFGSILPEISTVDYASSTTGAVCTYEHIGTTPVVDVAVPFGGELLEHAVFFYIVVGREVVAKINVTSKQLTAVIPRTHFGCAENTIPDQNNVYGISNGAGQTVWANGHTPVHLYENYVVNNGTRKEYRSTGLCRKYYPYPQYTEWRSEPGEVLIYGDGSSGTDSTQYALYLEALKMSGKTTNSWFAGSNIHSWCRLGKVDNSVYRPSAKTRLEYKNTFLAKKYKAFPMEWSGAHQEVRTVALTSLRSSDVPILQDIGYVYGCTSGINYDVSNGQMEDHVTNYRDHIKSGDDPYEYFSPMTMPVLERGADSFWGVSMQGVDASVAKPYVSGAWMNPPDINTMPPSSQLGMAASIPVSGSLSAEPHSIWQTNGLESFVAKLDYNQFSYDMELKPTPIYRFSYKAIGIDNVYVGTAIEKNNLDASTDWSYYRTEFYAFSASVAGSVPIYRYRGEAQPYTHFYTTSASAPSGYISEGVGFYAYDSEIYNTDPVYRFKSKTSSGHFLTVNEFEKNNTVSALTGSWTYDGIAFYAYKQPVGSFDIDFPSYPSISSYVDGGKTDFVTKIPSSCPTHVAVDDTNSIWVFCRGSELSGVYKIKRNSFGYEYPYGLSATYNIEDKLFGNANHNSNDVIEEALILKYALSGYEEVSGGSTFDYFSAMDFLCANEFPIGSENKSFVYNFPASLQYDYTGKYTQSIAAPVYLYKHGVENTVDYEYNSNNTGLASIFVLGCVDLDPDYCHPDPTPPSGILVITDIEQETNTVCDTIDSDSFWGEKSTISTNRSSGAGYDDLTTTHAMSALTMGSYQLVGTWWEYTDISEPVSAFYRYVGDSLSQSQAIVFSDSVYHWKTPNVSGSPSAMLPGVNHPNRQWDCSVEAGVITHKNVYEYSEDYILGYTNHTIGYNVVDVYERWPSPIMCGRSESCGAAENYWGVCGE